MKNILTAICSKKHSTGLQPGYNQIVWRKTTQSQRQNYNFYTLLTATKVVRKLPHLCQTYRRLIACSTRIQNILLIMLQNLLSVSGVTNSYRKCSLSSRWRAVSIYTSICITNAGFKYYSCNPKHRHYPFSRGWRTCNLYPTLYTVLDCFSRLQISSVGF